AASGGPPSHERGTASREQGIAGRERGTAVRERGTASREQGIAGQHASVVEDWLRQRHGDLVYTARTYDEHPVLLWFLLEHQSRVEPLMAWEILQKAVAMMKDWRSKHPDATRLPAVLSFVLYNGDAPWTAPTSVQELIELSEPARADFGDFLLSYRYVLDDLQATPTEALDARDLQPLTRLVLLAMKLASSERMLVELRRHHADIAHVLHGPQGEDRLEAVLYYLWSNNDTLTVDRLGQELESVVGPELEQPMRTVAQQLEQKGYDKGRDEGQRLFLVRLLEARFGPLPPPLRDRVSGAKLADIERWGMRVLVAASLDEVFAPA
uniref:Rpn family recombination-promoting nuclease/putative transposase n=1 Tax=Haliangium sp. TaxID=2663208 RepID=UPI003D119156